MMKWAGLVALIVCLAAVGMAFTGAVVRAADSVVTEIRIDDEGVRLGDTEYDRGEGVTRETKVRVIGEDIVQFGDDINIEEDEAVEGDVVAILGSIVVNGMVEGDVVAVGGELTVGPRGEIEGDAVAVGGGVTKEPGAKVQGETVSIGTGRDFSVRTCPFFSGSIFSRGGRLLIFIIWTVMVVVLGLVIMAVFRRGVDNVCMRARKEAFKMGLIGLLAEVLLVPVILLFIVTIIGIPIGVFVLPLVFALALLLGFVGVSYAVGARLGNGHGRSPYSSMAMGVFALHGLAILAGIIGLPGGSMHVIGKLIGFIGWAVIYVAGTVGLGAVIMSKFGTAELKAKPAVTAPTWSPPAQAQGPQPPPSPPVGGQGPQGMPPQGTP
jgi:cytoskeletal protein CcmA (bactofilin family)